MIETILRIASNISTPLALGGTTAAFLFLIVRQMLSMKVFAKMRADQTFELLRRVLYVFFWLALVAAVLGVASYVAGMYYPRLDPDYVGVGTDTDQALESVVAAVARGRNVTINFGASCGEAVKRATVEPGQHEGRNMQDFLERLKDRLREPGIRYRVEQEGERRYEIVCP